MRTYDVCAAYEYKPFAFHSGRIMVNCEDSCSAEEQESIIRTLEVAGGIFRQTQSSFEAGKKRLYFDLRGEISQQNDILQKMGVPFSIIHKQICSNDADFSKYT